MSSCHNNGTTDFGGIISQLDSYFGSSFRGDTDKLRATSGGDCCGTTTPLKCDLDVFISVDIFGPRHRLRISCRMSDKGR